MFPKSWSVATVVAAAALVAGACRLPAAAIDIPFSNGDVAVAMQYGRSTDPSVIGHSSEWNFLPAAGPKTLYLTVGTPFRYTALCMGDRDATDDRVCEDFGRQDAATVTFSITFASHTARENTAPVFTLVQRGKSFVCTKPDVSEARKNVDGLMQRTDGCDFSSTETIDWNKPFDVTVTNISVDGATSARYRIDHPEAIR